MNNNTLPSKLLVILVAVLMSVGMYSCADTDTTDPASFAIYYTGMTDIGPSMNGVIGSPTYLGSKPSDFFISQVTLDGQPYDTEIFSIDAETGVISIATTKDTPVGLYRISITCVSNGKTHRVKDAVEVNMMRAVPEGISVEPNKLQADYGDISAEGAELPTAQVMTDGNHVSIRKYEIAKSEFSDCFAISQTGVISIVKNSKLIPGRYLVSLKLTTGATSEEEGIFENAVEINITSKPLELTYNPATGKIEEETAQSGQTSYTSNAPVLKGSTDGIRYSIEQTMPETDKITIDAETGVLSVAPNHGLKAGESYAVSVRVANEFAPEGVLFAEAFTLEVVDFIEPVSNFGYADTQEVQAVEMEIRVNEGFKGDEVKFEFVELAEALQGQLSLDTDGTITAKKGHAIPLGAHVVKVKAVNPKSDEANPTIASFTLTVTENPNFFTYFRYGNNLGLDAASNADQFRIAAGGSLSDVNPAPIETDAKVELKWTIKSLTQTSSTTIDPETGAITLAGLKASQTGAVLVTATAGEGKTAVSVSQPVFFTFSQAFSGILVEYTPFVICANPKKKTISAAPNVQGAQASDLFMDYRRTFSYFNLKGNHVGGAPTVEGSLLYNLWAAYYGGDESKTGTKNPVSFFANPDLTKPLLYIDNKNNNSLVVNPEKWTSEGEYANGLFFGQIPFSTKSSADSDASSNPNKHFPIVVWFDTNF